VRTSTFFESVRPALLAVLREPVRFDSIDLPRRLNRVLAIAASTTEPLF
jgi:hypothetical protein